MKYTYLIIFILLHSSLYSSNDSLKHYTTDKVPKNMSVAAKKARFYYLVAPVVDKIHNNLMSEFLRIQRNIKKKKGKKEIENLKIFYKVKTNKELLAALKPHPKSIVIAQAAMESAWATSRFFTEANNLFGMWSKNPNEPRIAAKIKRKGKRTIWLKKFNSVEDSVKAYFRLMARGKHFKEFRKIRYETDDVHEIVKKLDNYSEIGHFYGEELSAMIKFNKLTKYDN